MELGARAAHVRRRLTPGEAMAGGCVMRDVRGTAEAETRLAVVRRWLPAGYVED